MKNAIVNWSGGKDCAYALYKILTEETWRPAALFTTVSEQSGQVPMHEIPEQLIDAQAASCGLPLEKRYLPARASNLQYEQAMQAYWEKNRAKEINTAIFGDIFLEDVRRYREAQLAKLGVDAVFPLWKMNTRGLVKDFLRLGFKAVIVAADARYFGREVAGSLISEEFIRNLPESVDPCGENGEFHTFVFDGPVFSSPVPFNKGTVDYKEYPGTGGKNAMWQMRLLPQS